MPKSYNQKMKILYIMKALFEKSDENHVLSTEELIKEVNRYGIKAERKSIYDDIEALRLYGMDIISRRERPAGYYLASREFELPELKLLVDAVQSSKFITYKKSKELINKLEGLASKYDARQLHRQVFVANRIKTMNESIYYNVDKIHNAISNNVKISFQYYEWTVTKEMRLKRDGEQYIISPWALSWDDENYYLIGYDEGASMIKHYRVDKMLNIVFMESERVGREYFENFNTADYTNKTFGMFGGKDKIVELIFKDQFIGVVIDRFGKDIPVIKQEEHRFKARVNIALSSQFYGWVTGIGEGVEIAGPPEVVNEYKEFLEFIIDKYRQ